LETIQEHTKEIKGVEGRGYYSFDKFSSTYHDYSYLFDLFSK
jgi:hypothetical protein